MSAVVRSLSSEPCFAYRQAPALPLGRRRVLDFVVMHPVARSTPDQLFCRPVIYSVDTWQVNKGFAASGFLQHILKSAAAGNMAVTSTTALRAAARPGKTGGKAKKAVGVLTMRQQLQGQGETLQRFQNGGENNSHYMNLQFLKVGLLAHRLPHAASHGSCSWCCCTRCPP